MQSTTALTLNVLNHNPIQQPPPTRNLVEESILIAKQTFVDGIVIYKKLVDLIEKHPIFKGLYRYYFNPQPIDNNFQIYNANHIAGTNLIAAEGPQSKQGVAALIQDTLYNKKMPIRRIIAFGSCIGGKNNDKQLPYQDFFDYCTGENSTTAYGDFQVTLKKISGEVRTSADADYCYLRDIIQSELSVHKVEASGIKAINQLLVTVYPLDDMCTIALDEKSVTQDTAQIYVPIERRKKILWDVYQESLKTPLLIHCAAGVGRTGHLILMFEIMREYDRIFASENVITIAAEINQVLARIRQNRPALVCTDDQFTMAIRNAVILRQYGLEQRLLQQAIVQVLPEDAKAVEPGYAPQVQIPEVKPVNIEAGNHPSASVPAEQPSGLVTAKEPDSAKASEVGEVQVCGRFTVREYQ